ncbi:MurR/RpiR family transcriptional regulator [Texcoconibacillus texcoconensis]|uniref:DNA-binding MurR/RpiR family transcriptional regulator n=1 Tax=Texcoconibacillus texcoconensis TaxID=1095777 RepID=A0A840QUY7_9BACI|nr:MurR/RpiR family transcriptional regulator [Texcoconibacillus texcoconensis]MBB5175081.1 DNA-binding MurR/RpiR family transcriptional regulator [Texcoconibacillus texcoconensis]
MSIENFIVEKVKSANIKFTRAQQLVADYVLKNSDKFTYMTANQIAKEVGVSETTVIRFSLTLGYRRFSDLQDELRQLVIEDRTVQRLQKTQRNVKEGQILNASFEHDMKNLQKSLEQIDEFEFNDVVKLICGAKHTYIIGLRSSLTDAYYLAFSLNAMLGNVEAVTDNGLALESCLLNATKDCVVICFSFTRFTAITLEALQYIKKNNQCKVVTITDSVRSPAIQYSDYVFIMNIDSLTPIDSHVSSIAFSNALIAAIGQRQNEKVEENLNTLESYFKQVKTFYDN